MTTLSLLQFAALFVVSLVAASVALWITGMVITRRQSTGSNQSLFMPDSHYLFEGNTLVDHDAGDVPGKASPLQTWSDLRCWLSSRFDNLPHDLSSLQPGQDINFKSTGSASQSALQFCRNGPHTRLTLSDDSPRSAAAWHTALTSLQSDLGADAILRAAPDPIWRTNTSGVVVWQNQACIDLFGDCGVLPLTTTDKSPDTASNPRHCIPGQTDKDARWYEVRSQDHGDHQLHFATDITQVIQAETVQREFVQTLTKTFANLTTGLAIFDKNRQLALFNPALLDLTGVSVSFLSARPDLMHFFDQLREKQVLPEPKSYPSWRAQIRDAVTQANKGLYQETWTLPTGLTYRVTGRPHPDGAVAFLFEDISAEMSLTRRFRAQIDLRQSVLDGMEDAIAVIAPNNLLMFCNRPCSDLLQIDPDTSFADMSLQDLLRACRDQLGSDSAWAAFEQNVLTGHASKPAKTDLTLGRGHALSCELKPLPGGVKMLVFSPAVAAPSADAISAVS